MVIDPEGCIDCALCEPECPAQAIVSDTELPKEQRDFLVLNTNLSKIWPNITEKKEPPQDAAAWDGMPDKRKHLKGV
tara:strand:+ start:238 stop:468 length:231 start_codon:yes stop_codon:yes gene_type:complete